MANLTLQDVKSYIKVDFDDDDSNIQLMLDAATEYITGSVGECDPTKARVRLLLLSIVGFMYETRTFTLEKDSKVPYPWQNTLLQLRWEYGNDSEGGEQDG